MQLYIDDVRMDKIKELFDWYPVDGVTSNPSVLKKGGRPPMEVLREVRSFIGSDRVLMTQAVSTTAEGMLDEARAIVDVIGTKNTYVKVPANKQGMKAIRLIKDENPEILVNATAVYSTIQALVAAKAGADLVAPYIGRVDNLGGDGLQMTFEVQGIFDTYGMGCKIVPGSFRSVRQVLACAKNGIFGGALPVAVWDAFLNNAAVDAAVDAFNADFHDLVGGGMTFADL